VFSSGLSLGIQIFATIILARLLTPQDFGLVAMVSAFSLLLMNFGLNGFTEAILQRDEISHSLSSNLFWINVGCAVVLTLGFALAGSLIARFYGNPLVTRVASVMSLTILFTGTSVVHLALLKRALLFSVTSGIEIFARAVSVVLSMLLGWMGWGYWALVAGSVAAPLASSIAAWSMCRWIPSAPKRVPDTGSMVSFAIFTYGRFTFNYFARNVDNFLVGWRFGAPSLGFYKKAYDLFALSAGQLTAPLTNVAVSALSRFNPMLGQYKQNFLRALSVTAFVAMALAGDLTLIGSDLIRLLLGPGWEVAGRIFTFFGPGIGVMVIYYMHGWIHLSIGKADRWLRWGVVEASVTFLLFILMLRWGVVGIAMAWTLSFWILTIPAFWYAGKPIGLGPAPVLAAVWKYVIASLLGTAACFAVIRRIPLTLAVTGAQGAAARVAIISALFGTLYTGVVILLYRGGAPIRQVARLLREMVARREPSSLSAAAPDLQS
jgi:PST family polysaccharide transporter